MNETRRQLLRAARRQFAQRGYDAASIRGITRRAHANLGAVTYHFGSKQELYLEVLQSVTRPLHQRIEAAAATAAPPLERIENIVRAFFAHTAQEPDLPALMLRELALERPIPAPVRTAIGGVFAALCRCLEDGQRQGAIVAGDVRHLAIACVATPIYTALAARPLREVARLDLHTAAARQHLVDDLVALVRRGLAAPGGSR